MGTLALALGALTIAGVVQLWHVYVFAFLFGSAAAFDAPVRQTFVAELVGDADLHNAVALNSTSFNTARMIGPAVSGLAIGAIGTGWAFLINGASFIAGVDLADEPAGCRAAAECPGAPVPREFRRRAGLCLEAPRFDGDPGDAVPDRDVWPELPDLHLDHGGQRFSHGCERVWPVVVDHGDRHGDGRIFGRTAGEAGVSVAADRCGVVRGGLHVGGAGAGLLVFRRGAGDHRRGVTHRSPTRRTA